LRAPSGRPDWDARPWTVLFLRHDRIGDMIVSTGAIRAIAAAHPNLALDVLASPANAPVLAGFPGVRGVVVFDRRRPSTFAEAARALYAAQYDCVVDCMVTAPSLTTAMLMAATRAPWRVGIAGRGNDAAYTLPVPPGPGTHMADRIAALAAAFGVQLPLGAARPTLALSAGEVARAAAVWSTAAGDGADAGSDTGSNTGPRLLLNVSAGDPGRQWLAERWAEVVRRARARHPALRLVVTGAPAERDDGAVVVAAAGGTTAFGALRDMFALVATADVVLTPDTSVVHVASAFARPTVVIGPARAMEKGWGPYGGAGRYVPVNGSMRDVPVAPVADALDAVLMGA